jgi:nitrate reductase NapE component
MERSRTISIEPSGEQSNNNRLFIFLAIALLGLICIGLVGLGGAV